MSSTRKRPRSPEPQQQQQQQQQPIDLPPELWREILARLPVASVLRFRCVSKSWLRIIDDDPHFISLHLTHFNNNNNNGENTTNGYLVWEWKSGENSDPSKSIFTIRSSDTLRKTVRLLTIPGSTRVRASLDGLILMIDDNVFSDPDCRLTLWNPSIRKSLILPPCPFAHRPLSMKYALGFDPSSNDYKVVAFQCGSKPTLLISIAIYSVGNNFWRVITDGGINEVPSWWLSRHSHGFLFSGGAIHWMTRDPNVRLDTHVVSFDLSTEELSCLELPDDARKKSTSSFLFLLGKSVAVLCRNRASMNSYVWVMGKDGGREEANWTEWYSGDSSSAGDELFRKLLGSGLVTFYVEKNDAFLMNTSRETQSYNIRNHEMNTVAIPNGNVIRYMDIYKESLVLSIGCEGQTLTYIPWEKEISRTG